MKIAVMTDLHGNMHATTRVLEAMNAEKPDVIICLGDVVDPLPSSSAVLKLLTDLNIPILRGNHEDYVLQSLDPKNEIASAPNWAPVRQVAKSLSEHQIRQIKEMAISFPLFDTRAGEILFCHASPRSNMAGWREGKISNELGLELQTESANVIVCGHWHDQRTTAFEDKRLISIGSVGVPLHGEPKAEYAWIEVRNGEWHIEHRSVPYDVEATLREYRESGWLAQGGPMAWLSYDEIRTQARRLGRFRREWLPLKNKKPTSEEEWASVAQEFLTELGSWPAIKQALMND